MLTREKLCIHPANKYEAESSAEYLLALWFAAGSSRRPIFTNTIKVISLATKSRCMTCPLMSSSGQSAMGFTVARRTWVLYEAV